MKKEDKELASLLGFTYKQMAREMDVLIYFMDNKSGEELSKKIWFAMRSAIKKVKSLKKANSQIPPNTD